MSYLDLVPNGIHNEGNNEESGSRLMGAVPLVGQTILNLENEHLGSQSTNHSRYQQKKTAKDPGFRQGPLARQAGPEFLESGNDTSLNKERRGANQRLTA